MEKVFFIPVPEEEFYERIANAIHRKLLGNKESRPSPNFNSNWLTHSEAAAFLKMSPASLYKLTSQRKINYSKRGRPNYYSIENLEKYLQEGEVKTAEQVRAETKLKPRKNLFTQNKNKSK